MNRFSALFGFVAASTMGAALGGCAARPKPPPSPVPAPALPPVSLSSVAAPAALSPAASPEDPPAVPAAAPPAGTEPVYRNPTIAVVRLRAHQDAEGRLLGPQVMYQVTDPGGWNLEAVERGAAYIPPGNAEPAPTPDGPERVPGGGSPLLDPGAAARMVLTGLMRPEQQPAAEAQARSRGEGWSALYDPEAGWLLVPR